MRQGGRDAGTDGKGSAFQFRQQMKRTGMEFQLNTLLISDLGRIADAGYMLG